MTVVLALALIVCYLPFMTHNDDIAAIVRVKWIRAVDKARVTCLFNCKCYRVALSRGLNRALKEKQKYLLNACSVNQDGGRCNSELIIQLQTYAHLVQLKPDQVHDGLHDFRLDLITS